MTTILKCHLETGVSVEWLVAGIGESFCKDRDEQCTNIKKESSKLISQLVINDGQLETARGLLFDNMFLPENIKRPLAVYKKGIYYITDREFSEPKNGLWLLKIEGTNDICNVTRIPVNNLIISGGDQPEPIKGININDVKFIGKVRVICNIC